MRACGSLAWIWRHLARQHLRIFFSMRTSRVPSFSSAHKVLGTHPARHLRTCPDGPELSRFKTNLVAVQMPSPRRNFTHRCEIASPQKSPHCSFSVGSFGGFTSVSV